jgi:prepilin-type N-terminal cleavage/methylation domain-containing protein
MMPSVQKSPRQPSGFSLLELLVVVVIISALALIASPYLTGASSKAKISAVKGNVASAAVSASVLINLDELTPADAVPQIIQKGNYPDAHDENTESAQFVPSPFDSKLKAYGGRGPGQVEITLSEDPSGILIQGYDGQGNPIPSAKKFVPYDE